MNNISQYEINKTEIVLLKQAQMDKYLDEITKNSLMSFL